MVTLVSTSLNNVYLTCVSENNVAVQFQYILGFLLTLMNENVWSSIELEKSLDGPGSALKALRHF